MKLNYFWILSAGLGIILVLFVALSSVKFFQNNSNSIDNKVTNNDYKVDTGITPINFSNVSISNNKIISIEGTSEPDRLIVLLNNNKRINQIESNNEGIWEADVLLDNQNIMAIEVVMFYSGDISIRGDETLYSIPSVIKNNINNQSVVTENSYDHRDKELNILVMLTAPGGPSRIIQSPFNQTPSDGPLAMSALDYDDSGGVIFSGTTNEAGLVKVYAGEILVGETRVEAGGRWNFIAGNLLPVGKYYISSELVKDEAVAARIDVPFVRMMPLTSKEKTNLPRVVYDLESWQISRPLLGGGIQHTVIFASGQKVLDTETAIEVTE
jgi:hypothetical protein